MFLEHIQLKTVDKKRREKINNYNTQTSQVAYQNINKINIYKIILKETIHEIIINIS